MGTASPAAQVQYVEESGRTIVTTNEAIDWQRAVRATPRRKSPDTTVAGLTQADVPQGPWLVAATREQTWLVLHSAAGGEVVTSEVVASSGARPHGGPVSHSQQVSPGGPVTLAGLVGAVAAEPWRVGVHVVGTLMQTAADRMHALGRQLADRSGWAW